MADNSSDFKSFSIPVPGCDWASREPKQRQWQRTRHLKKECRIFVNNKHFAIIPTRSICAMWLNYLGAEFLKFKWRNENPLSFGRTFHNTLNFMISCAEQLYCSHRCFHCRYHCLSSLIFAEEQHGNVQQLNYLLFITSTFQYKII